MSSLIWSAAQDAISARPGLETVAQRLAPRNAGEFWTLVGVISSVIAIATGSGDTTTINKTINVNNPTINKVSPSGPEPKANQGTTKKPPLPPKKQREQRQKRRKRN